MKNVVAVITSGKGKKIPGREGMQKGHQVLSSAFSPTE